MKSGIYLITCARPGQLPLYYVGQSHDCQRRQQEHFGELRRRQHHNHHMQAAYDKYGAGAFAFDILETGARADLQEMEQFWIDHLVGHPRCMNISRCVEAFTRGLKHTADTIERMRAAKTGLRHTPETRRRISELQTGKKRGPHKEQTRQKIGAAQRGERNHAFGKVGAASARSKAVRGVHADTGAVIDFESARLAAAAGFSQSAISAVCAGRWSTHKGYRWSFISDAQSPEQTPEGPLSQSRS